LTRQRFITCTASADDLDLSYYSRLHHTSAYFPAIVQYADWTFFCTLFIAEKSAAIKDLAERVEILTSDREAAVAQALAQQAEELDYLKAELASTKVRLRDALSQNQAEKDALLRHVEVDKTDLLRRLEEVKRESSVESDQTIPATGAFNQLSAEKLDSEVRTCSEKSVSAEEKEARAISLQPADKDVVDNRVQLLEEQIKELNRQLELKAAIVLENSRALEAMEKHLAEVTNASDLKVAQLSSSLSEQGEELQTRKRKIEELEEELERLNIITEKMKETDGQLSHLESERTAICNELASVREQLVISSDCLKAKDDEIKKLCECAKVFEEELSQLKISMENLKIENDGTVRQAENEKSSLQGELNLVREELSAKCALLTAKEVELASTSEQLRVCEDKLKHWNSKVKELEDERQNAVAVAETEKSSVQLELDSLRQQLNSKCSDLEAKGIEISKISDSVKTLEEENQNIARELTDRESEIERYQQEISALKEQFQGGIRELEASHASVMEGERLNFQIQLNEKISEIERLNKKAEDLGTKIRNGELESETVKERLNAEIAELRERIVGVEHERKVFQSQTESKSAEMENRDSKIHELDEELRSLKEQLRVQTAELENKNGLLKTLEDEIANLKLAHDKISLELKHENEARVREEQERYRAELEEKLREIEDKNSQTLEETRTSAAAKQASLLSEIQQQKDEEVQSLLKKHETDVAEMKTNFDAEIAELRAKYESSSQDNLNRIADLENVNRDLNSQLEHLTGAVTEAGEEKIGLERTVQELRAEMDARKQELEDLRRQLGDRKVEEDPETSAQKGAEAKLSEGLKLLLDVIGRLPKQSDELIAGSISTEQCDSKSDESTLNLSGLHCNFSELANQVDRLIAENTSLHERVNELESQLLHSTAANAAGGIDFADSAEIQVSSATLQAGVSAPQGERNDRLLYAANNCSPVRAGCTNAC
jgi:chromosome segregation ATPase